MLLRKETSDKYFYIERSQQDMYCQLVEDTVPDVDSKVSSAYVKADRSTHFHLLFRHCRQSWVLQLLNVDLQLRLDEI